MMSIMMLAAVRQAKEKPRPANRGFISWMEVTTGAYAPAPDGTGFTGRTAQRPKLHRAIGNCHVRATLSPEGALGLCTGQAQQDVVTMGPQLGQSATPR
jgi:hypothetical protein